MKINSRSNHLPVLSATLIFCLVPALCYPQDFLTFEKKDNASLRWYYEEQDFNAQCLIQDNPLKTYHGPYDVFTTIYFDDDYRAGLKLNTTGLEYIKILVEGVAVDPFRDKDGEYDAKTYIIDLNQTVVGHLIKRFENKLSGKELQAKVSEIAREYLTMGGRLELQLKFKSQTDIMYIVLIPESYGLSFFNKALPVTAQYSASLNQTDEIKNAVNLYYPIQYIVKDLNREGINATSVTNKISFGPYILTAIDQSISFKGGGIIVGFGLSPKGQPIVGAGFGFAKTSMGPFLIYTINPIECARLLFNPAEIFQN